MIHLRALVPLAALALVTLPRILQDGGFRTVRVIGALVLHSSTCFDRGFDDYDALLPSLAAALHRFAAFNGCTSIHIEQTKPGKVKAPLSRALNKQLRSSI